MGGLLGCFQALSSIFKNLALGICMPSGESKGACTIWPKEVIQTPRLFLAEAPFKSDSLHLNRWEGFKVTESRV